MDSQKQEVLERQGYRIVGEHSGVKLCHWTKASLTKGVGCYKQTFYGIESHRCLQMTPTVDAGNLACQFCWRTQEWGSDSMLLADDPGLIVEDSIRAQRELLSGFKGNPNVTRERFLEAWHPTNVAISLTGEPTLYKRLGEMIDEFKRRKMSTFLVTNGTTPAVLRRMHSEGRLPTQLYVTVAAPNAEIYRKLVAATVAWSCSRKTARSIRFRPDGIHGGAFYYPHQIRRRRPWRTSFRSSPTRTTPPGCICSSRSRTRSSSRSSCRSQSRSPSSR